MLGLRWQGRAGKGEAGYESWKLLCYSKHVSIIVHTYSIEMQHLKIKLQNLYLIFQCVWALNYLIFTQCTSFNIALFRVIHEFLHSLGFQHEHTRPDRDQHITVNFKNIQEKNRQWWEKHGHHEAHVYGSYDICSIMHYKDHGFVKRSGDTNIIIITKPKIYTCY